MKSYHVFTSAKDGINEPDFEGAIRSFLESQITENYLLGYRVLRYSEEGNFGELPRYQVICDYASEDDLKKAFEAMRPDRWKQDPHAPMMKMVSEFRVAFSEDISKSVEI